MLILALFVIALYLIATATTIKFCFSAQETQQRQILFPAILGMCIHALLLGMAIIRAEPEQNLSVLNVASAIALLINLFLTSMTRRQNSWILLPITYVFTSLILLSNIFIPHHYLTDIGDRPGLVIHIALALMAYALMSIASLFGLLHLYLNHQLKQRRKLQLANLPPLLSIEKLLVRLLQIGAGLLTASIATGFLFLDNLFSPNNLDKAGFSIIAWFLYATLLIGHHYRGWRGQRLVILTLTGNVLLAIAYFGSRFIQIWLH